MTARASSALPISYGIAALGSIFFFCAGALPQQDVTPAVPLPIATIEGKSVELEGTSEIDASGRLRIVAGAQVRVASDAAQLHLTRGGDVSICGPARIGLSSGAAGALLLSLQQGGLELRYPTQVVDSLLTADYRLLTIVPPGEIATVSASVELHADGALCVMNRGSAMELERLWDGATQTIINGQTFLFQPDAETVSVAACGCASPAPAPVASSDSGVAAPLFQHEAALTYNAGGPNPPPTTPPPAPATAPAGPPPTKHHNAVVRFFRWFVGKPN